MSARQTAKLFTHGGSQAVRLPKAFRFEGAEVSIRKEGDKVILEPVLADWSSLWNRIDAATDEPFPDRPAQLEGPELSFDE